MVARRIISATAFASLIAVGTLAAPATAAAPEKIESKVTLHVGTTSKRAAAQRGTTEFSGRVKSDAAKCVNNRTVTLYTEPEGGDPRFAQGSVVTKNDGKWSVDVQAFVDGDYYAEASKKPFGSNSNPKVCKRAISEIYERNVICDPRATRAPGGCRSVDSVGSTWPRNRPRKPHL